MSGRVYVIQNWNMWKKKEKIKCEIRNKFIYTIYIYIYKIYERNEIKSKIKKGEKQ